MFKYLTIDAKILKTMKTGTQNHHTAILSTERELEHDKGSIRHLSSWHIDPCRLMFVAGGTFPPATAYCFFKVGNVPLSS